MADFRAFSGRNSMGSPSGRVFAFVLASEPQLTGVLRRASALVDGVRRCCDTTAVRAGEEQVKASPQVPHRFFLQSPCHEEGHGFGWGGREGGIFVCVVSPSPRTSRRSLLLTGAATMTFAQAPAPQGPPPPKKARITSSVMLWTLGGSFDDKLQTAAKAGLQSVELVTEHVQWTDADVAKYRKQAQSFGLGMDTILAQPDWTKRPVTMVNPADRDGFLNDVKQSIEWSKKLEIPQIILMSGNEQPGMSHDDQFASLLESAKRAADLPA